MMEREIRTGLIENNIITDHDGHGLPYDLESEQAILSLCLTNSKALNFVVSKQLSGEEFYDKRNKTLFEVIQSLYNGGEKIDQYSVNYKLVSDGKLNKAGGKDYIFKLLNVVATYSNVETYVSYIKEKYQLRRIIDYSSGITEMALEQKCSSSDIIDTTISGLTKLRDNKTERTISLSAQIRENIAEIHRIATGEQKNEMIKTGFAGLDYHLGGLQPGGLYIIAARPGIGKTSLALNIATNIAINYNKPINFFSLEMQSKEVANKILSTQTGVSSKVLQSAKITADDEKVLGDALQKLSGVPIYINDSGVSNPLTIRAELMQKKNEGKLGVVIIDYLQLMKMPNIGNNTPRNQEVSELSRGLKVLASELQVPVIALSQLNRRTEQEKTMNGEETYPKLSDLRESGSIEQDANVVIFIHRKDTKKDNESNNDESGPIPALLIVAKNRSGSTGKVKVMWDATRTLYYDADMPNAPTPPPETKGQTAFRATTTAANAASDYSFEDTSVPFMDDIPMPNDLDIPPVQTGSGNTSNELVSSFEEGENVASIDNNQMTDDVINSENEKYFDGMHTDLPPGF